MFLAKVSIPSLKKVQGCKHNAENLISWNGMNTNFHVIMPFSYHVLCINKGIAPCAVQTSKNAAAQLVDTFAV